MVLRSLFLSVVVLTTSAFANPLTELAAFSSLKNVDLAKLMAGEVVSGRGPTMSFQRGLAIESAYVVKAPLAKTLELQRTWSPAGHGGLKIYLHTDLPAKPTADDFRRLAAAPQNGPVKALITATEKIDPAKPALQLSAEEAKGFGAATTPAWAGPIPGPVAGFWSGLLAARAQAFSAGGVARQPAYFWKGESISAADEVGRLFKEVPKVRAQFSALAGSLTGGAPAKTAHYWELADIEGQAAFSLGATLEKPSTTSAQTMDVQYYASGGYFVLVTFYQLWPIEGGTLVWRGDLISSPQLGELRGMERMGSSAAMMKQVKQFVTAFLKDSNR